ncbi:hypothetical protein DXG01_003530 [Tephrocybe rancida]|nr:hypothetical protein DXG01_003530 [Tephrocybe rancida]
MNAISKGFIPVFELEHNTFTYYHAGDNDDHLVAHNLSGAGGDSYNIFRDHIELEQLVNNYAAPAFDVAEHDELALKHGSIYGSRCFFQNTGAVAGVFTVVGLIALALLIALITNIIRRRRAKRFNREVEEAAAEAANAPAPIFLSDDNDYHHHQSGYGADAGGYSDDASHGTYSQPPMSQTRESYGMRDAGPAPGELYGSGGAAGVGVARARSTRDPGAFASGLQEGATPYPAFAGPGAYQSGVYGNTDHTGMKTDLLEATGVGVGAGAGTGVGRGMSLNHYPSQPQVYYDQSQQRYPNPQQDLLRNPSATASQYTGTTLASASPPPKELQSYTAHYASGPGPDEGDAYGGYIDEPRHALGEGRDDAGNYYEHDEERAVPRVLKVSIIPSPMLPTCDDLMSIEVANE